MELQDEAEEPVPPPTMARPTTLEAAPVEEEQPPPRRRRIIAEDPYAPLGLAMGGLSAFPALGVGGVVTDNVRKSARDQKSDIGLRLRPSLRLESDWVRHSFRATGSGDFTFYEREPDFDDAESAFDSRLTIDVRHGTHLDLDARYSLSQSSPSDRDVPDAASGTRDEHRLETTAALRRELGRIEGRLFGGAAWQGYDDVDLAGGGVEDNSDRDYVEPEIGLRLTSARLAALKPFVEIAYRPRLHDRQVDRNGVRRDSDGYAASAGVVLDISEIWSGEMALTYLLRDYEDPSLERIEAVGATGNITWRPTALTALTLATATSIDESGSTSEGGTRNYDVRLDLVHGLRDNLDLLAGLGANYDDAEGGNDDLTFRSDLGAAWRMNPWFAWTAGYDAVWFDAAREDSDYTEHRLSLGFEVRR